MVNVVHGDVSGMVVQAGEVHGGIHIHHPRSGSLPLVLPAVPATGVFVGRDDEVRELLDTWSPDTHGTRAVSVVAGMGGVGKTALVHHAATLAERRKWFTGGVVVVDMLGYDAADRRVDPSAVFAPALRALGVDEIPTTAAEQAVVYQRVLDSMGSREERVLLILDNVAARDQLDGLLPRNPLHRAVVATRDTIPLPGAHVLELTTLGAEEGRDLLVRLLDDDPRATDVPEATERLVRLCAGLPLAVGIAAAVLAEEPTLTVAAFAAELDDAGIRLARLEHGASAVGTAFDVSWRRLLARSPPAARLLALLVLDPGPGLGTDAAAALLDDTPAATLTHLRALRRAHLLEQLDGRWWLHDLVRLHVGGQATAAPDPAAVARLSRHYLHVARDRILTAADLPNLTAVVALAAAADLHDIVLDLVDVLVNEVLNAWHTLDTGIALANLAVAVAQRHDHRHAEAFTWLARLLWLGGRLPEAIEAQRQAVDLTLTRVESANRMCVLGQFLLKDRQAEAAVETYRAALALCRTDDPVRSRTTIHSHLAEALVTLHRPDEAIATLHQAIDLARARQDTATEGALLCNLAVALSAANRGAEVMQTLDRAVEVCRASGNTEFEAYAWANLAVLHAQVGQRRRLAVAAENARRLYASLGDKSGQSTLLANIGMVGAMLGSVAQGVAAHQQVVEMCRAAGNRAEEGEALFRLGVFLTDSGKFGAACTVHRKAVDIWRELGNSHREALELRALAGALAATGRHTAAARIGEEAIEVLLDTGERAQAAAIREWLDSVPAAMSPVEEPDEPTPTSVTTNATKPGLAGCLLELTIPVIPVLAHFGAPWWLFVGWAVAVRVLTTLVPVGNLQKHDEDLSPTARHLHSVAIRLFTLALLVAGIVTYLIGGPPWLLALCTVLVVLNVRHKIGLLLFAVIAAVTAYYTWGTPWMWAAPVVAAVGSYGFRPPTRKIEVG
ncbi:tetratricopeptide repeat protein [Saccharothrix deserti]|uniref:tetratricopeptide repeat protein n=1 Tax=Saccharothrix deserti TaxID=2593674 RepID=UPI00131BB973|nr:tetratricopeptide repeat protein [Saccharothrix deserti]